MSEATALATVGCQLNSTLRWFQDAVLPDAITAPPPLPTSLWDQGGYALWKGKHWPAWCSRATFLGH